MNWDKEEKEEERKAEESERKEKELAEEKERQKQEKLKSLIKFKIFSDPFDQSNPLYDHLKFEYYSKGSDENGNECWIIYVSKDVADILIAEQNRLKDEEHKAVEKEKREIRRRRTVGRIKIIAYWSSYIIAGLVFATYFFNRFNFNMSNWGKIAFFVFLTSVPFLAVKIVHLIFTIIRGY
jgi:hypothetical protein